MLIHSTDALSEGRFSRKRGRSDNFRLTYVCIFQEKRHSGTFVTSLLTKEMMEVNKAEPPQFTCRDFNGRVETGEDANARCTYFSFEVEVPPAETMTVNRNIGLIFEFS